MEQLNSTAACVLGLLDLGPPPPSQWSADGTMTGAAVWTALEQSVNGFWSMTRSQVYQELRRLGDAGLVNVSETSRYAITPAGRDAARRWFTDFALGEPKDEQLRSPIALTVFFGHYLPTDLLERVVHEHGLRFQRRLDALRVIEGALDHDRSLPGSTLQRAILYLAGAVEWTQDVLERLSKPKTRPRRSRRGPTPDDT